MDIQRPAVHRQSHEEDPQNTDLHTVIHEEDGHDKSVLKKVKAKAKKVKDTLKKHGHGHEHDQDEEEEESGEEMEQDLEVHGVPMFDSAATRSVLAQHEDKSGQSRAGLGPTSHLLPLEKDPQAPKDRLEPSDPGNYQTKVTDPTGPEARVTPLISSFGKMGVSEDPDERKPCSSTGSRDQFLPDSAPTETKSIGDNTQAVRSQASEVQERPNQSSYAEKVSSAASTIAEKAISAKNVFASKLGYGGNENRAEGGEANKSATMGEYGHKVAATVTEKLAPVYEKVVEAGSAVVSKMPGTGSGSGTGKEREGEGVGGAGKGVSVKKYVAEKLRPSDEDKALSEVISEALHKRKGKDSQKQGKVTESPEVAKPLGSDQNAPSNEVGKGMVETVRGTVSSWLGKNKEQQHHQPPSQVSQSSSPAVQEVCQDNAGERKLNESTN